MTHTKDEALKLALEALEKLWLLGDQAAVIANPAITAIKQALAAPTVQEPDWLDKEKPETDWDHVWLLIKAASYASARGHMSGTTNWCAAMSAYLRHSTPPAAQPAVQDKCTYCKHGKPCQCVDGRPAHSAPAAPVQPVVWTAPEQCDSPPICRIRRACAGQFETQKKCTTPPAAPVQPVDFETWFASEDRLKDAPKDDYPITYLGMEKLAKDSMRYAWNAAHGITKGQQ